MISSPARSERSIAAVETTTRRSGESPPRRGPAKEIDTGGASLPTNRTPRAPELGRAAGVLTQIAKARSQVPGWSSRLVFLLGLVNIASAVLPRRPPMLAWSIGLLPPMGLAT